MRCVQAIFRNSPAWSGSLRKALISIGLLAWTPTLVPQSLAQSKKPTDYQVKAVYLYNFGRFVEWPDKLGNNQDPFTICVLGQDPFGATLDSTLAGETIAGRAVVARRIAAPEDAANCRILFMGLIESSPLRHAIATLKKQGILTVSDVPQFADHGGMIQFVVEGNKIRFAVNLTAAQQAGLSLSSELLKVATAVRTTTRAGEE
jgi:YfiR/HmsC-like